MPFFPLVQYLPSFLVLFYYLEVCLPTQRSCMITWLSACQAFLPHFLVTVFLICLSISNCQSTYAGFLPGYIVVYTYSTYLSRLSCCLSAHPFCYCLSAFPSYYCLPAHASQLFCLIIMLSAHQPIPAVFFVCLPSLVAYYSYLYSFQLPSLIILKSA